MTSVRAFRIIERLSPGIGGLVGVFSLKAVTTGLSFALVLLAAHALGATDLGTYSLLFSVAGLLSVAATFGQHVLLMRSFNEYCAGDRPDLLKGHLVFSAAAIGLGSAIAAIAVSVWCALVHDEGLGAVIAAYVASLSVLMGTTHLVRSAVGVGAGDGWGYVLTLAPAVAYLALCLAGGELASLTVLFAIMTTGAVVTIIVHCAVMRRAIVQRFAAIAAAPITFDTPAWTARSLKLWMSSVLEAANQYIDVIIVGLLLSAEAAGVYFVMTRLANVIAVGADAIHMYATRHLPAHHYGNDVARLNGLLDTTAWATLAVAIGGMLGIAIGGEWLLIAFGTEYGVWHGALLVLSVGVAIATCAVPPARYSC